MAKSYDEARLVNTSENRLSCDEAAELLKTDDSLYFNTTFSFAKVVNNEEEFIAFASRFLLGQGHSLCSILDDEFDAIDYDEAQDDEEDDKEYEERPYEAVKVLRYNRFFAKPFEICEVKIQKPNLKTIKLNHRDHYFEFPSIAKICFMNDFDRIGNIQTRMWSLIPLSVLRGGTVVL